ncbi:hypothetical protein ACFFSW_08855 [Saccharothrix longispora]|uniref:Uncharacterized protein n=1 Tax=Saccharothrix longispora TaxID=33920 RepID=A0ABU1Q766_9PSEU|nr:hypothetical protein [Saccharothrix longispora]MDR6598750.1 hypothetical protein [Saccharothrix longispora]
MSAAPAESALLDEWLAELVRRRWTFHRVPDRESPRAIAAVFRWRGLCLADVVVLLHADRAQGYRVVLTTPDADPFRPEVLAHSCEDTAIRVIREVLTIPPPDAPAARHRAFDR